MTAPEVRWKQRLQNFQKALEQFDAAVALSRQRPLSDLEKQGLIQAFEFTHELAWNVMRDYFVYQGNSALAGSRDATREAFQNGLIENGDQWMKMIQSRNQTSQTYNKITAEQIVLQIQNEYAPLFSVFYEKMVGLAKQ